MKGHVVNCHYYAGQFTENTCILYIPRRELILPIYYTLHIVCTAGCKAGWHGTVQQSTEQFRINFLKRLDLNNCMIEGRSYS